MKTAAKQTTLSIASIVLSFLASSHHMLHMGLLALLGGSLSSMEIMDSFIWLRRIMIAVTMVTVLYSVYRLMKHRCKQPFTIVITIFSVLFSLYFVVTTLSSFGW